MERRTSGYQSFPNEVGSSDSVGKLVALQLPPRLDGLRVLDIGCNEGFFSIEAYARGAAEVIGIDADEIAIERARQRSPDVTFKHQGWETLPPGEFDVILMLSALHYEDNPRALLQRVARAMRPNGIFILEAGVSVKSGSSVQWTQRPIARDDVVWYPTRDLLIRRYLEPFTVREVGPSVSQRGDAVVREVFHCVLRRPTVLLIGGPSRVGKTALARELAGSATMTLNMDSIMYEMVRATNLDRSELLNEIVQANRQGCDIGQTVRMLEGSGKAAALADLVVALVPRDERLVAVEGYVLTDEIARLVSEKLADRAVVWTVARSMPGTDSRMDDAKDAEIVRLQADVRALRARLDTPRPDAI